MNPHMDLLKTKALSLPETPGIYLMKDSHGSVVYVGKAKSLKNRVISYFRKNQQHTNKTLRMVHGITDFETIDVDTELDALLLECQLIQELHPMYNRQMNQFTNYRYLDLSHQQFQLEETRSATTIGPFRRIKQLPLLFQLLSETYQLDTLTSISKIRLEKQLPIINALSAVEKWQEIDHFFKGEETNFFLLCQERLTYLTDQLLFEQAQILTQQQTMALHAYQEIRRINQFWHTPNLVISCPVLEKNTNDIRAIKYYVIRFGQLLHTELCSPTTSFDPPFFEIAPRPLEKSDLDSVCILLNFQHRSSLNQWTPDEHKKKEL